MKILLITLIVFLTLSSVFGWDPGPMTGVKIKNAILYLLLAGVLLRAATHRGFRIELPGIHIVFVLLIAYAVLSYLAVVLVADYPRYDAVANGLLLKVFSDNFVFFLVFFYGLRSREDAVLTLKCLLAALALSHGMALLDALGVTNFSGLEQRSDGRVQGLVGESNQYGAFVALSLPALIAMIMVTRSLERVFWFGAVALTAATLVMTVSRGAFVAVIVAAAWALFFFRRYVSPGRIAAWAVGLVAAAILATGVVIALGFGDLLYERLVSDTIGTDIGTQSSGRSQIWSKALQTMGDKPLTFLTGFGWRVYWEMPFRFSPHNYYLNQWFNLGLVGLVCSVLLFVLPISTVRAAAAKSSHGTRPIFLGFAVAAVAFAAATFFVDLYVPWLYFWAYAGIVLRLAVDAIESGQEYVPQSVAPNPAPSRGKTATPVYGWSALPRRR